MGSTQATVQQQCFPETQGVQAPTFQRPAGYYMHMHNSGHHSDGHPSGGSNQTNGRNIGWIEPEHVGYGNGTPIVTTEHGLDRASLNPINHGRVPLTVASLHDNQIGGYRAPHPPSTSGDGSIVYTTFKYVQIRRIALEE